MFVARWQIDAKFGHKNKALDLMRQWDRDIGQKAGTVAMNFDILTGSIGAHEATIETNHRVESLAQLEEFFTIIGQSQPHADWGKELEQVVVSGSSFWQIFRVVER